LDSYTRIVALLRENNKEEHLNIIEFRHSHSYTATELIGNVGNYLLKIKATDEETYQLIKEPLEEYLRFYMTNHKFVFTPQ
jgi:hypothetical protein